MGIRLQKKSKSNSYYKACGVYMADRWRERVRTLTGEVSLPAPNPYSDISLGNEKSAEAIVVKTSNES